MSEQVSGSCWNCGQGLGEDGYHRESTCPGCRKYTHVCKNCRFYASGRPNSCLEPIADEVMDKERANFCGYFEPTSPEVSNSGQPSQDDLFKAAEDLFK
ncbi:MAG: hypothetical protein ABFR65_12370 [Pseudomonadota bacterium]